AKMGPEQVAVAPDLPERLGGVALGEVDRDHGAMRTLAERLAAHADERDLERVHVASRRHEPLAEDLERVQAQLAKPLALDADPIVVPVREEFAGGEGLVDVTLFDGMRDVANAPGPADHLAHVDTDRGRQAQGSLGDLDERGALLADAPERRPQAARRVLGTRAEPEDARGVAAVDPRFVQREEREDSLGGSGHINALAIAAQLERAREAQSDVGALLDRHHNPGRFLSRRSYPAALEYSRKWASLLCHREGCCSVRKATPVSAVQDPVGVLIPGSPRRESTDRRPRSTSARRVVGPRRRQGGRTARS